MSHCNIAALVQSALQPLQDIVATLESLQTRGEASRAASILRDIHKAYESQSAQLRAIEHLYIGRTYTVDAHVWKSFDDDVDNLRKCFRAAHSLLLDIRDSTRRRHTVRNLLRSTSLDKKYEKARTNASDTMEGVLALSSICAEVKVEQSNEVCREPSILPQNEFGKNTLLQAVTGMESNTKSSPSESRLSTYDVFRPSFVVPANPPYLLLLYDALDVNGKPRTPEATLKASLLKSSQETSRLVSLRGSEITAAVGMGGVGKSCALRGLASDSDVIARYPGGIYYMSLGMDARLSHAIEKLATMMDLSGSCRVAEQVRSERSLDVAVAKATLWFNGHDCLFIVDDLWRNGETGSEFLITLSGLVSCSPRSALVYATRDRGIAALGENIEFGSRDVFSSEARGILLSAARYTEDEIGDAASRSAVNSLLERCAGLPVALSVVGHAVFLQATFWAGRREDAWVQYVEIETKSTESVLRSGVHGYPGLAKSLEVALRILNNISTQELSFPLLRDIETLFEALCVLQKQGWAPESVLSRLWGFQTCSQAREMCSLMARSSLVNAEVRKVEERFVTGLSLHDLIHEFCVQQSVIRRRLVYWHTTLLESYLPAAVRSSGSTLEERGWWSVTSEDGYIQDNVCRHLAAAGLEEELANLLLDPRWIVVRLRSRGIGHIEQDFHCLHSQLINREDPKAPPEKRLSWVLRMIVCAARRAAQHVARNPCEVWFQLHGRLQEIAGFCEGIRTFLRDIERWAEKPWVKPLTPCLRSGPGGVLKSTIVLRQGRDLHDSCDRFANSDICVSISNSRTDLAFCGLFNGLVAKIDFGSGSVEYSRVDSSDIDKLTCVTITADAKLYCAGTADGIAFVWKFETTGGARQTLHTHSSSVTCIAVSRNGHWVISGSEDGTVLISNVASGSVACSLSGSHRRGLSCVAISEDGGMAVTGSRGDTIRVWNCVTGMQVGSPLLCDDDDPVSSVSISSDGRRVMARHEFNVYVWDIDAEDAICTVVHVGQNDPRSVLMTRDGTSILCGGDEAVNFWNVSEGAFWDVSVIGKNVILFDVSSDGSQVVEGVRDDEDLFLRIWDIDVRRMKSVSQGNGTFMICTASSCDGRVLVIGYRDGTMQVWDTSTGERRDSTIFEGVSRVAVSSDGLRVVAASSRGSGLVWNLRNGKQVLFELRNHGSLVSSISSLTFAERGNAFVCGQTCGAAEVVFWGDQDVSHRATLEGHTDRILCSAISADCQYVATGSRDGSARVWHVASRFGKGRNEILWDHSAPKVLEGHTASVSCVALAEDGNMAATGSADRTVRVWNCIRGQLCSKVVGSFSREVRRVTFTPSLLDVVSVSRSGELLVWSVETGAMKHLSQRVESLHCPQTDLLGLAARCCEGTAEISFSCKAGVVKLSRGRCPTKTSQEDEAVVASLEEGANTRFVSLASNTLMATSKHGEVTFLRLET